MILLAGFLCAFVFLPYRTRGSFLNNALFLDEFLQISQFGFFRTPASRMCNHEQRRGAAKDALHAGLERLGIEGGEALVEHNHFGILKQSSGNVEPAAFAVGQLPTHVANHLKEARRHALDQFAEA